MTRFLVLTSLVVLLGSLSASQPLSGSYTVGGTSPDFATLQDAANALKLWGVSGPVAINIRPGIYMREGRAGVVMRLDTVVVGASPTNRISPDGERVLHTLRSAVAQVSNCFTGLESRSFEDSVTH